MKSFWLALLYRVLIVISMSRNACGWKLETISHIRKTVTTSGSGIDVGLGWYCTDKKNNCCWDKDSSYLESFLCPMFSVYNWTGLVVMKQLKADLYSIKVILLSTPLRKWLMFNYFIYKLILSRFSLQIPHSGSSKVNILELYVNTTINRYNLLKADPV